MTERNVALHAPTGPYAPSTQKGAQMGDEITAEQVAALEDTRLLWDALRDAKQRNAHRLVRAIERRMRELAGQRRFTHLSDDELAAQIRGLAGNRAPENMLRHNPGAGPGTGHAGAEDTSALNRAIKANQKVGIETTLAALVDEWQRRKTEREAGRR